MNELTQIETLETNALKFNESIDSETLDFLQIKTLRIAKISNNSKMDIGKELKEARDVLSQHGYGCYDEWLSFMKIPKSTAFNYINSYEFLIVQPLNEQERLRALPSKVLYEASRPNANEEIKQAVLNGTITSNKELEELKKELSLEKNLKKNLEEQVIKVSKENQELKSKVENPTKETITKEVIKEVVKVPDDYKELKEQNKLLKSDNDRLYKQYKQADDENWAMKNQLDIKDNLGALDTSSMLASFQNAGMKFNSFLGAKESFQYIPNDMAKVLIKSVKGLKHMLDEIEILLETDGKGEIIDVK